MTPADALPETVPVRPAHRFDTTRLDALIGDGLGAKLTDIRQMRGGQSNPTFLVSSDRGEYVLRKQPPGKLLPSAHAIDREFRIISALAGTDVPVRQPILYCDDATVIGTPFYLMERLVGRVFWHPALADACREERRAIYDGMGDALARMHRADWTALGLADYGRQGNYFERQIGRWTKQWNASRTRDNPAIDRLAEWLPQNVPPASATTIVHGDFRLDNMVFHPREPRVIGILDWELSTLGDPLTDLAYNCIPYVTSPDIYRGLIGCDIAALGLPGHDEYVAAYYARTGLAQPIQPFHYAFSLFRLAVILEGVLARAKAGNASNTEAGAVGDRSLGLAGRGWELAQGA